MICIRNYIAAHSRSIYGVSVRPSSVSSFVTGSVDYSIYLWDENVAEPAIGKDLSYLCCRYCVFFSSCFYPERNYAYLSPLSATLHFDVSDVTQRCTLSCYQSNEIKIIYLCGNRSHTQSSVMPMGH